MVTINPYLTFNGNCTEVLSFYKECLGGELVLLTIKDSPMANEWPANMQHGVLHGSLSNHNMVILGSDTARPEGKMIKGNTISLSLSCSTEAELQQCFSNLSKGGKVTRPLHEFFGGTIGTLTDKFNMDWIFYYNKSN